MDMKGRSMGKWFVWFWAVSVVGMLALMQVALFGTRGLPKPIRELFGSTTTMLTHDAAPAASTMADDKNMVDPESLPQGFIVVVTDKTKVANASSPIYMPSSHNGWNPGDKAMQLTAQSDMKWRIIWEKPKLDSRIAFKFARGSWESVECKPDFSNIENRLLPKVDITKLKSGEKPIIELEIAAWKDQAPGDPAKLELNRYRPITVSAGTLQRIEVIGGAQPTISRDVLVWLPPGYDAPANADKHYSVLYLMDGQNVFEKLPSVPAEWNADETAAALIQKNEIEPIIIVGVPHARELRMSEYVPFAWSGSDKAPPRGKEFVNFLASEVKPRVDRAFRTKTDAANTAIGGASLGAVIAFEAATERPDVFGKVVAESMSFLGGKNRESFKHFAGKPKWPGTVVFGMGGKEGGKAATDDANNAGYVAGAQAFAELAKGKGLGQDRFKLVIDPDAVHNEEAWAKRLPDALKFLFPPK